MSKLSPQQKAGNALRRLIKENYSTQLEFALDYGLSDDRCVRRYLKDGINKVDTIQSLADFFQVDFSYFFTEPTE